MLASQMKELFADIKKYLEGGKGRFVREFFVLGKHGHQLGGSSKPGFIFYEEDHDNLRGQLDLPGKSTPNREK
jgi:hypothetical protein